MDALKRQGLKLQTLETDLQRAAQTRAQGPSPEEQIKIWRKERAELNEGINKDLEMMRNLGVSPTSTAASPKALTKGILGSLSRLKSPFGSASSLNKNSEISPEEQRSQKHNELKLSIDRKRERVNQLEKLIMESQLWVSRSGIVGHWISDSIDDHKIELKKYWDEP
jgi:hypothetical protein